MLCGAMYSLVHGQNKEQAEPGHYEEPSGQGYGPDKAFDGRGHSLGSCAQMGSRGAHGRRRALPRSRFRWETTGGLRVGRRPGEFSNKV